MKYSLRSLFVLVTLVAVVLGSILAEMGYERQQLRKKTDAAKVLQGKATFGMIGSKPKPFEEMQTWRGDETWLYTNYCAFHGSPTPKADGTWTPAVPEVTADELALLSSNFPSLRQLDFNGCRIEAGAGDSIARLDRLETLILCNTTIGDDDLRLLKTALPNCKVLQINTLIPDPDPPKP